MGRSLTHAHASWTGLRLPWRWLLIGPPALCGLALCLYGMLLLLAEPLLWIKAAPKQADAIVVLGGDGPRRAARAAQLYRQGMAPRVFVVGDGDCLHIALAMTDAGVPASAIEVECKSGNTWENAQFSVPLLARARVSSGIIVTSWFHTRRALASFAAASPAIAWTPVATMPDSDLPALAMSRDGWAVFLEYLKVAGYVFRYGIDPFDPAPMAQRHQG